MNFGRYQPAYQYMLDYFKRNSDEREHTLRVVGYAMQLLEAEPGANPDVVILAALLHDVGRKEARADKSLSHAQAGAQKALDLLTQQGWEEEVAAHVSACISTHSLGSPQPPQSLEAKLLFDADKLDLTGAFGVIRTVVAGRQAREPVCVIGEDGLPAPGKRKEAHSLLRDYRQTLRKLPGRLYTRRAKKLAAQRQDLVDAFFAQLYKELLKSQREQTRLLEVYCGPQEMQEE